MHRTEDGAIVGSINVAELSNDEKRELGIVVEGDEPEDLSKLLKADLVRRADALGLETDGLNKAELVEALEAATEDTEGA